MEYELTLKEKDKIVKKIYKNYQRAQLDILFFNQHYNYYPKIDLFRVNERTVNYQQSDKKMIAQMDKKRELESFCEIIHQIHSHLSQDTFFFIEHEYLNFYDICWWMPYFSRASYYRLKHRALDEFLDFALTFWSFEDILKIMK